MLRVSKLTDYAVVVLSRLEAEGGVQTAPGLAAGTGLGEPTVAKVLKMLSQAGLVEGQRGARGGYRNAPTLGGFDQMTARLGGFWDSLLGEGRRWWIRR